MKNIKKFIKENKALIIGVTVTVVGGLVVYKLTKGKVKVPDVRISTLMATNEGYPILTVDNLEDAVDGFKEYQNISKTVGLFWENDGIYSVLNLDA